MTHGRRRSARCKSGGTRRSLYQTGLGNVQMSDRRRTTVRSSWGRRISQLPDRAQCWCSVSRSSPVRVQVDPWQRRRATISLDDLRTGLAKGQLQTLGRHADRHGPTTHAARLPGAPMRRAAGLQDVGGHGANGAGQLTEIADGHRCVENGQGSRAGTTTPCRGCSPSAAARRQTPVDVGWTRSSAVAGNSAPDSHQSIRMESCRTAVVRSVLAVRDVQATLVIALVMVINGHLTVPCGSVLRDHHPRRCAVADSRWFSTSRRFFVAFGFSESTT